MDFLSISNLILLIIAVVIFLRLRNVLGRRTGHERPPVDPYAGRRDERAHADAGDRVVTLPTRSGAGEARSAAGIDKLAPAGSSLNSALRTILSADRSFDPDVFLGGARVAYEAIVSAFAGGDRDTLRELLAPEVYDGFVAAIDERERRGESVESTFVGLDVAEITEAALKAGVAQVTVRFVSQLITVTRDKDNTVVDGDPGRVVEVTDVWTFAREIASRDPNWRLVATAGG